MIFYCNWIRQTDYGAMTGPIKAVVTDKMRLLRYRMVVKRTVSALKARRLMSGLDVQLLAILHDSGRALDFDGTREVEHGGGLDYPDHK